MKRISAMPTIDSGVSVCSHGPVVEAPEPKHYRTISEAGALEDHPFWLSTKAEELESSPPYTDGRSRVILANDGTKDCLALLLTPALVAALSQTTHDILALEKKDGAIERIEAEVIDLAGKAANAKETIRNPRYQDRMEEMQLALEILQLKRQEAEERKSKLKIEQAPLESSLKFARYESQQILEDALLEASLLNPPEPEIAPTSDDDDDDTSFGGDFSVAPSTYSYHGAETTPSQQHLRDAQTNLITSYDELRDRQARFDDRHADYDKKLAKFSSVIPIPIPIQKGSEAAFEGTRTDFDLRHIQHVRNLTQDLVSAERAYRNAKATVRALEQEEEEVVHVHVHVPFAGKKKKKKHSGGYGADDGGSDDISAKQQQQPHLDLDLLDRERIEAWARACSCFSPEYDGVKEGGSEEENKEWKKSGLDDDLKEEEEEWWDARGGGPVEMGDSISAVDREEYGDEISEWKRRCWGLRG